MHALTGRAIRESLAPPAPAAITAVAEALLSVWPKNDFLPEHREEVKVLRENSDQLLRFTGDVLLGPMTYSLPAKAAWSLSNAGLVIAAADAWEHLYQRYVQSPSTRHIDIFECATELSAALLDAGRIQESNRLIEATMNEINNHSGQ